MSSLKRLAIRTKQSLSGLYSFSSDQGPSPPVTAVKSSTDTITTSTTTTEGNSHSLEEFKLGRDGSTSPGKNSPSRRKRLLGSLRSMGSIRSLRSSHSKPSDEPPIQVETPKRARLPLALDFELTPLDQPIFDPGRNSPGFSGIDIHHSSPITVSAPAKPLSHSVSLPPGLSSFAVGSVPDSPAPFQRALVQESILGQSIGTAPTQYRPMAPVFDIIPTPMPGTNLPLEEFPAREILVSLTTNEQDTQQSYFAMPLAADQKGGTRSDSVVTTRGSVISDDPENVKTAPTANEGAQPETVSPEKQPVDAKGALGSHADSDPFTLDPETRESSEHSRNDLVLAYLALGEADGAEGDECALERRQRTWGRTTGLYDGTGYGDELALHTPLPRTLEMTDDIDNELGALVVESAEGLCTSDMIDEREALQDIIRAYAAPMFYQEEAEEEQGRDGSARLSKEEAEAWCAKTKADVALSIRIMNRSLGG